MADDNIMLSTAEAETTHAGAIATLRVRNKTMGPALFDELERHLDVLEDNAEVRVVIVRGADPKALSLSLIHI